MNFQAVNVHSTSYLIGVIGLEAVSDEVADVNMREGMNFAGIPSSAKLQSSWIWGYRPPTQCIHLSPSSAPATRSGGLTDRSGWLAFRHRIKDVTKGGASEVKAYRDYIKDSEVETRNIFECENIQLTQPDQNIPLTRLDQNIPLT